MGHGVVWIVGVGAAAGLGAAVARRFASEGLLAVVTGRDRSRLAMVVADITAAGAEAVALSGDASSPQEVERLATEVQHLGPLRGAIYNAGNAVRGTPLQITPEVFEAAWRVGTFGGFLFGRAALPALLAAGGGSLLFTGATASLRGRGEFVAFAAAKAGLRSVAQSFAREYGPQGVHVAHIIIDGGIDGEQLRSRVPQRAQQAAAGALLRPEAIAEAYWQLHRQDRSAWTHELDLRPYKEAF